MNHPLASRAMLVVLASTSVSLAGEVLIVAQHSTSGETTYAEIQDAVTAAADGDVILIRSGTYSGFSVTNKSLFLAADTLAVVTISGPVMVSGLSAQQQCVLQGVEIDSAVADEVAFQSISNAGNLWLDQCVIRGGIVAQGNGSLTLVRSEVFDRKLSTALSFSETGAPALEIEHGNVSIYDSKLTGGDGASGSCTLLFGPSSGFSGASAVKLLSGFVFVSGSTLVAGNGGDGISGNCFPFECSGGGHGGSGLELGSDSATAVVLSDNVVTPGVGGFGPGGDFFCLPGKDGEDILVGAGSATTIDASARSGQLNSPVRESEELMFELFAEKGDTALISSNVVQDHKYFEALGGTVVLPLPMSLPPAILLPSGYNLISLVLPQILAPGTGQAIYAQSVFIDVAGQFHVGAPVVTIALDESLFLDCNTNGIPDEQDLLSPELNCNNNTVVDECESLLGWVEDCNADGIPSSCSGDCNSNGMWDDCDIEASTSIDCNNNLIPDECDITSGYSQDQLPAIGDGVPDECQSDCNLNGSPDQADLASGGSDDCNSNSQPDECDIAMLVSDDCDQNLIPDECSDSDHLLYAKLLGSPESSWMGETIDVDGNRMVLGDGPVHVFERDYSGSWMELAQFDSADAHDGFGGTVSISGDTVAVGAYAADDLGSNSGAVTIYREGQDGLWYEEQRIVAHDGSHGDGFGWSVSLDGHLLAVGAPLDGKESVYVYERSDQNQWEFAGKLTGSQLGFDLQLDGQTLAARAYDVDHTVIRIYRRVEGSWILQFTIAEPDIQNFGRSFALQGDVLAVSNRSYYLDGEFSYIFTYQYDGIGNWNPQQVITDAELHSDYGESLALTEHTLVASAQGDELVYVYRWINDSWYEQGTLTIDDSSLDFASALGISGSDIIVGDRFDNEAGPQNGAAYVFRGTDCNDNGELDVCDLASGFSTDIDNNGTPDECQ